MIDELEYILRRPKKYAEEGWVQKAIEELELAREDAAEKGIKIPAEVLRDVERAAYKNGAELQVIIAVIFNKYGNNDEVEKAVQKACIYATYAGVGVSQN